MKFTAYLCPAKRGTPVRSAHRAPHPVSLAAFTLVEVLVSLAVLAVLLTIIAQVLGQVQRVWSSANSKVAQFREARRAMDRIQNNLAQATMNTYLQYYYVGGAHPFLAPSSTQQAAPTGYVRFSELQFVSGQADRLVGGSASQHPGHAIFFQAPLGGTITEGGAYVNVPTALTACGYYLEFGTDQNIRPPFLSQTGVAERLRFRLFEYRPSILANLIYKEVDDVTNPGVPNRDWYGVEGTEDGVDIRRPVAENIIYMVFSPKRPVHDSASGNPRDIAPQYAYDSSGNGVQAGQAPQDFQIPPLVEVTLVALDEDSARRFVEDSGGTPSLSGSLFTNASDASFRDDIEQLENQLNQRKLNYRIFNATVPIRNSKWGL